MELQGINFNKKIAIKMTLKQSLPDLERISLDIFGQKLSGRNIRYILEIYRMKKIIIKLNTK